MLTEKDYCDYESSVALKELGYVGICDAYYELTGNEDYNRDSFELLYTRDFIHPDDIDRVAAPLLYQAQKWMREEKHIEVLVLSKGMVGAPYDVQVYTEDYSISDDKEYSSYEEALSEGVRASIKILQDEQKENN